MADRSTEKVLLPQLYVRLKDCDVDGSSAELASKDANVNLSGDPTNSGTLARATSCC